MSKAKVQVVVDSKEPPEVYGVVSTHDEVLSTTLSDLPSGDLLVAGNVLVERKTPEDFASSITGDKRNLYDQCRRMTEEDVQFACVLLEGNFEDFEKLTHTSIPAKALRGAAASVTIRTGVPVIPCGDLFTLVDMAVRYGRKTREKRSSRFVKGSAVSDGDEPETVRLYATLPKVGVERAFALYEEFPSVETLVAASVEDIEGVEGFGPQMAQNVYQALRND